jgi:hypothetical protein
MSKCPICSTPMHKEQSEIQKTFIVGKLSESDTFNYLNQVI